MTAKIDKAYYIKEERRDLHKKLIWIIPFLGALIIRNRWKKKEEEKLEIITKDDRKTDRWHGYESGLGTDA